MTGVKSEDFVTQRDCAFAQPIGAGQLEHGGEHFASVHEFWWNREIGPEIVMFRDFNLISSIFDFFSNDSARKACFD